MHKFLWCSCEGTWAYIMVQGEIATLSDSEIQRRYKEEQEFFENCEIVGIYGACSWSAKFQCVKGSIFKIGSIEVEKTFEQPDIKKTIEKNIAEEYKKITRYLK
jgi:hypothetical protein